MIKFKKNKINYNTIYSQKNRFQVNLIQNGVYRNNKH